jgi:type IV secretion system protein VirB2
MIANFVASSRSVFLWLGRSHVPVLAQRRQAESVVSTRLPDCQRTNAENPLLYPCSKSPLNRPIDARRRGHAAVRLTLLLAALTTPTICLAQASPFQTGATALQTNLLTLLTPVAVILVIALGVGAMVNRISWAWCIAAIAGIALSFGAPQIVTWIRGMFAV